MTVAQESLITTDLLGRKVQLREKGSGEPLMVLHHSTGNYGWLPFYEALSHDFRVLVPDLPGYGQSERPEWARDARDLAILIDSLMEELRLADVTLVGLGFGGYIAAELATMNPLRLKRLVLVGAAGLKPNAGEILDQMMVDFADYVRFGFRDNQTYEATIGEDGAADFRELWDYSREMTARLTWSPYMFSRRLPHLLRRVKTPALIVWGGADRVIPPICAHQYAEALPNSELRIIDKAGHLVEMEEPDAVARLITGHLGSIDQGVGNVP